MTDCLENYIELGSQGLPSLNHPMVYFPMFNEELRPMAEKILKEKMEGAHIALQSQEWEKFVSLHEKHYRPSAVDYLESRGAPANEIWKVLRRVWLMLENFENTQTWWEQRFERANEEDAQLFMGSENWAKFLDLKFPLRIYRGGVAKGLSWTVDEAQAEWFAERLGDGEVRQMEVSKAEVFAFLEDRKESEIILRKARW